MATASPRSLRQRPGTCGRRRGTSTDVAIEAVDIALISAPWSGMVTAIACPRDHTQHLPETISHSAPVGPESRSPADPSIYWRRPSPSAGVNRESRDEGLFLRQV
jgi:hypothetical protein